MGQKLEADTDSQTVWLPQTPPSCLGGITSITVALGHHWSSAGSTRTRHAVKDSI